MSKPVTLHFKAITIKELLETNYPPHRWIVEKILPIGGLAFLAGKAGHAKSLVALNMAQAVAEGQLFANHFPTQQTGVLIIDEENSPIDLQIRSRLFGLTPDLPIYFINLSGFSVLNPEHIQEVLRLCQESKLGMVLMDSLIRVHDGKENDADAMRRIPLGLRPLLTNNISVLMIHHEGKMGTEQKQRGMRGSSELDAMADSVLLVKKDGRIVNVIQSKLRQTEANTPFDLELLGDGESSLSLTYRGQQIIEDKDLIAKEAVRKTLKDHGILNQGELVRIAGDACGIPTKLLRASVLQLERTGDIYSKKGEHGAIQYSLLSEPSRDLP